MAEQTGSITVDPIATDDSKKTPAAPKASKAPTATVTGNSWDDIIRQAAEGLQETSDLRGSMREMHSAEDRILKSIADEKPPTPPELPKFPEPPQANIITPIKAFGSAASIFAVFASLLTRHPLVSALNASAAAIKSARQGDWETYKLHLDNWKNQTEFAMRQSEYEQRQYETALQAKELNDKQKLSLLTVMSNQFNDEAMMVQLQQRNLTTVADLLYKRQALALRMSKAYQTGANRFSKIPFEFQEWAAERQAQGLPVSMKDFWADKTASISGAKPETPGSAAQANAASAASSAIDDAERILKSNRFVAGAPGAALRRYEGVAGWFGASTDAQDFQSKIIEVQNQLARLGNSRQLTTEQVRRMENVVRGLGLFDTPTSTQTSLENARKLIGELRNAPVRGSGGSGGGGTSSGAGAAAGTDWTPAGSVKAFDDGAGGIKMYRKSKAGPDSDQSTWTEIGDNGPDTSADDTTTLDDPSAADPGVDQ